MPQEFKTEPRSRGARIRSLLTASIIPLLLLATIVGIFVLRAMGMPETAWAGWLVSLAASALCADSYYLAACFGMRRAGRAMTFTLAYDRITRHRAGSPDITILLSEIASLRQKSYWLVVASQSPRKIIVIPKEVNDFAALQAELAKYCTLTVVKRKLSIIPLRLLFPYLILPLLAWFAFLWVPDRRIAFSAGIIAYATLAVGSRHWWQLLRRSRVPTWLAVASLASIWVCAVVGAFVRTIGT